MITSAQNKQVKEWKKLQQRKYRKETGNFLIEGFHLVEEAFKSDWEIETVLLRENTLLPAWAEGFSVEILTANIFKEIAETQTPQGIAAIVKVRESVMLTNGAMLLVDGIQDPGNLGTIIRTADAFGFSQVILGKGSVDVYNEKVIRASQGSIFHIPITEMELNSCITFLKKNAFTIWASTLAEDAIPLKKANFTGNTALIVGNEGEGISPTVINNSDNKVMIPIMGKAESFNVAVAAGIMMYAITEEK